MKSTPARDTTGTEERLARTSLRRAVLLHKDQSGEVVPVVVYRRKNRRRKGSLGLRTIERVVRRTVTAAGASANSYTARHNRSNEKKKDGWLRDLPINVIRAQRRGLKDLRLL